MVAKKAVKKTPKKPAKRPVQFVIYQSRSEVLICRPEKERAMKKEWFDPEFGRDMGEYDRYLVTENVFQIVSSMWVWPRP